MKSKMLLTWMITIIIWGWGNYTANAQYIEDAIRYSGKNGLITARSAGLGIAYNGIADDMAALFFNPAGLSLVSKSELSIGLGFTANSVETNYMSSINSLNSNDGYFTHAGFVAPFKVESGNAAIGIGYFLENNYSNNYIYNGFNRNNTMVGYLSKYGNRNIDDNPAYHLWLANENLKTPLLDSLYQSGDVQETGGLHNVTGGAAFDLSKYISAGFTITGKWGTYGYSRLYSERDIHNKYNLLDTVNYTNLDFRSFTVDESIDQEVFGITGSLGIQCRIEDFMRIGATVKFPTFYEINENFGFLARAQFDDGWEPNQFDPNEQEISYKIRTPFVYSGGISLHAQGFTFSAGIEYTDVTQLKFSDENGNNALIGNDERRYFENLNRDIIKQLVGTVEWGVGGEYELPGFPAVVRASFSSVTSPYQIDVPGASYSTVSIGGGFYPVANIRLDAVFSWNSQSILRSNYGSESLDQSYFSKYTYKISPFNIGLQFTYRY